MLVTINRRKVDVLDSDCAQRPCFALGFDKGTYVQGRGYTSYHTDTKGRRIEKAVCMTRHLRGCPINSVCGTCRRTSVRDPGAKCDGWGCDGTTVARNQ